MKIVWLVANVTNVGSPDRAERAILEVVLARRFFVQAVFVVEESLCYVGTPS